MMNTFDKLFKTVQRRTYDFISTKHGLTLFCISLLVIFVCLIQLSDTILEYRLAHLNSRLSDVINFKNASFMFTKPWKNLESDNNYDSNELNNIYNNDETDDSSLAQSDSFYRLQTNIDAVYTWVNGSDPDHLKLLRKYKLLKEKTLNKSNEIVQVEFEDFFKKIVDKNLTEISKESTVKVETPLLPCFHKFCMQTNNLIVIIPQLSQSDKQILLSNARLEFNDDLDSYSNLTIENIESSSTKTDNEIEHDVKIKLSILQVNFDLSKHSSTLGKLNKLFQSLRTSSTIVYKFYMGYYTIDCNLATHCIRNINRTFIIKKTQLAGPKLTGSLKDKLKSFYGTSLDKKDEEDLLKTMELPKYISDKILYKFDYEHEPSSPFDGQPSSDSKKNNKKDEKSSLTKSSQSHLTHLSVFKVKTKELDSNLSDYCANHKLLTFGSSNFEKNISYDLYRANIVWDLGDPFIDDIAENRFQDNDELKYSIRSLEKHAPWFRKIYIVTNGQIPHWLNLTHPKIKIITHKQIFRNQSHLPTFSSPAIESNLHRIKGLSKRFVYFNDDLILGKRVWPDDFFTQSNGFKIYLAWILPGCNTHCPSTWIKDGYCDKACNTSECEFDGGDCDRNATSNSLYLYDRARSSLSNQSHLLFPNLYCSPGCSTTWLTDSYCDNSCNVKNCAYDMGDCGDLKFKEEIYGLKLFENYSSVLILNEDKMFPMELPIEIPTDTNSFYINFTRMFKETSESDSIYSIKVINAQYEENKYVRRVSIVNKLNLLIVLLIPEALASSEITNEQKSELNFKILIQAGLNKTSWTNNNQLLNITLSIKLNAFNKTLEESSSLLLKTTTSSTLLTDSVNTTKKLVKINRIVNSNPNYISSYIYEPKNSEKLNLVDLLPENVKIDNDYFKSIYDNYYSYLNWSQANEYLTDLGLKHKLSILYFKLKSSELNDQYSKLKETGKDFDEKSEQLAYNFLFNKTINHMDNQVLLDRYLNDKKIEQNNKLVFVSFKKRKLLDTFADSLRHVNRLFNQIYGYTARKVPAHMPHMIDRHIMHQLQLKFKDHYETTSSNHFRSSNDMQYAFSYYYYLMSELEEFNASRLFEEFDLNGNNQLDASELKIINLKLSLKPFSYSDYLPRANAPISEMLEMNKDLNDSLNECKGNKTVENNFLDKSEFFSCTKLVDFLKQNFWPSRVDYANEEKRKIARYKYKFQILEDEETKFVMIGGNPFDIEVKLNNLIRRPTKFICLNDNIDYKLKHESMELKNILKSFYDALFPIKSTFENDFDSENRKKYLKETENNRKKLKLENDDLDENLKLNSTENYANLLIIALIIALIFVFLIYLVKTIIFIFKKYILNKLFFSNKLGLATSKSTPKSTLRIKAKTNKKEYKISSALRKKIEQYTRRGNDKSSSSTFEFKSSMSSDNFSSDSETVNSNENKLLNSNKIDNDRSSVGISMRPKRHLKSNKTKSKISNI